MAVSESFKEFVRDLLADFGPVTIRGAGVYADGVMFAILANDMLYLKTSAVSKYRPRGKEPVAMPYWEMLPRLLEEPGELVACAEQAHRIALESKAKSRRV